MKHGGSRPLAFGGRGGRSWVEVVGLAVGVTVARPERVWLAVGGAVAWQESP